MAQRNNEITFDIIEDIGVLSTNPKTHWTLRLRRVLWNYPNTKENQDKIKYDIRSWSNDDGETRMSRGLTLSTEECKQLNRLLSKHFG